MNASLNHTARIATLLKSIGASTVDEDSFELIAKGASGRYIVRAYGAIGISWTNERADNASFLPAARGLAQLGLRVPRILESWQDEAGNGACLTQDLGHRDLLSYKNMDWRRLKGLYKHSLQAVLPLYALRPDWPLQPPFDETLYRWEQLYFAEHFLAKHRGLSLSEIESFMHQPIGIEMAEDLASLPRMPIHRDLQSQNIMIHGGGAWLIDFQGMRMGRYEYDLGSLIFDPYMNLSLEHRLELIDLWEQLSGVPIDRALFAACTLQRLMQALGAFANLGYRQGKTWYLEMIPPALESMQQIGGIAPEGSTAQRLYATMIDLELL